MSRTRRIARWVVDAVLALAFGSVALSEVETSPLGLLPAAAGPPVAIAAGVALLFRRYRPLPVLAAAALAEMLVGAFAPLLLAIYTVANRYGNRRPTWLSALAVLIASVVPWGAGSYPALFFGRAAIVTVVLAVPLLLGLWTSQRRETLVALRERAEQAERERDLRATAAVEAERLRIAGELHDVVAHRISQITVLAGALEVSSDGKPAEIAGTIRTTGSLALTEMRELLGILREPVDTAAQRNSTDRELLRPAPDLAAIPELVSDAVAAGQRVELSMPEELPTVPGPIGRAAYRIVQEALTNAAKHAAGAEVRAAVAVVDGVLDVDVRNGHGDDTPLAAQGSGFGLLGMRKRVELAGGSLHSGPLAGGGYVVHATFPLAEPDSSNE
ncbi:histidine kinase [Nocardia sp. CDC153]|uniref:sensor histidine kinase n=1 Tax=Nocardia sp. CDC153 TaxID=3112167 RepID=UPI002DBD1286|nr:histidine kinase [Nocardia sp. CDC153]MEC3953657.1 histidine kinase [Nocardia sp. CDC153]